MGRKHLRDLLLQIVFNGHFILLNIFPKSIDPRRTFSESGQDRFDCQGVRFAAAVIMKSSRKSFPDRNIRDDGC